MSAKPRVNLILDGLILLAFLLTIFSGLNLEHTLRAPSVQPGEWHRAMGRHSWAAFAFIGLIAVHQLLHAKWITSQIKQLVRGSRPQAAAGSLPGSVRRSGVNTRR